MSTPVPYGSISFCLAATSSIVYGAKSLNSYLHNRTPLSLIHAYIGLCLALGLYSLALPFILSKNHQLLLYADYVSVCFMELTFLALARLLWFFLLRTRIKFRYLAVPIIVWGALILWSDMRYTTVIMQDGLLTYNNSKLSLILKSIIDIVVPWPVALIYLRVAKRQKDLVVKLRLGIVSLGLLLFTASAVIENLTAAGRGSTGSGLQRLAVGIIVLLGSLWPQRHHETVHQASDTNLPTSGR